MSILPSLLLLLAAFGAPPTLHDPVQTKPAAPPVSEIFRGDHVHFSVRAEPATVRPGGFVELVIAYKVDEGFAAISPRTKDAKATAVKLELPSEFRTASRVRAAASQKAKWPSLGDVEVIEGEGELIQRMRVGESLQGRFDLGGKVAWTIASEKDGPSTQEVAFDFAVHVDPKGAAGPVAGTEEIRMDLSKDEADQLFQKGFSVRARPEFRKVAAGEEFLVLLDVIVDDELVEVSNYILLEPTDHYAPTAPGWRTFEGKVEADGRRYRTFREAISVQVERIAPPGQLGIAVNVTMSLRQKDGTVSMAVSEPQVMVNVEP